MGRTAVARRVGLPGRRLGGVVPWSARRRRRANRASLRPLTPGIMRWFLASRGVHAAAGRHRRLHPSSPHQLPLRPAPSHSLPVNGTAHPAPAGRRRPRRARLLAAPPSGAAPFSPAPRPVDPAAEVPRRSNRSSQSRTAGSLASRAARCSRPARGSAGCRGTASAGAAVGRGMWRSVMVALTSRRSDRPRASDRCSRAGGRPYLPRALQENPLHCLRIEQEHSVGPDVGNASGFGFGAQPPHRDAQEPRHRPHQR